MTLLVPEPTPPVPATVSLRQFARAASRPEFGHITEAEAVAWLQRTALPAFVHDVIAALPATEQFDATADCYGMTNVARASPLISVALSLRGLTEADADAVFRLAATL